MWTVGASLGPSQLTSLNRRVYCVYEDEHNLRKYIFGTISRDRLLWHRFSSPFC
jgi:hypothetical protein